jgi:hypothetical protein
MVNYLFGIFTIANLFIAFFIALYAYLFVTKTQRHRERRPWDFLFIASILFFFFEFLSLLSFFNIILFVNPETLIIINKIAEFLYGGFVLLAFVSQHDLILKNHLILISKKEIVKSVVKVDEKRQK